MTPREKEKELSLAEKRWEREKTLQERELKLRKEKRDLRASYAMKPSTSKLLILFLFLNCTVIEIFTGWVTVKSLLLTEITLCSPDFTPLVTLIGAVVSEVIGFAVYALKSAKENSAGGIIFETAMRDQMMQSLDINEPNSDEAVG